MKNYFISDTHFGHANVIKYSSRPFADVQDMDAAMIDRWNSVVTKDDNVYHLGDFAFHKVERIEEILKQLNGKKHLVYGNHDQKIRKHEQLQKYFVWCKDFHEFKIDKQHIVLCHYSLRVWNGSHWGSIQLYGHSHNSLPGDAQTMDVGVDTGNDYTPYSYEQVLAKLSKGLPRQAVDHHV